MLHGCVLAVSACLSVCSRFRGKRAHVGQTGDFGVLRPCGDRRVSRRAQSCQTRLACPALRSPGLKPRPRTRLRMAPLVEFVASGASPASRPFVGRQAPAARIRESPRRALSPRSRLLALRGPRGACDEPLTARLTSLGTKPPLPAPHAPFFRRFAFPSRPSRPSSPSRLHSHARRHSHALASSPQSSPKRRR